MRPSVPALALALALAGCAAPAEDAAAPLATSALADVAPGVRLLDGAPEAPTLDAPPRWKTGEWWRIEVHDVFTGVTTEVTKVVVGERDGKYLVGMPAGDWNGVYLALHLPGLTEVDAATFETEVHDAPFRPVAFPLEDGASWETGWHQLVSPRSALTAEVTVESPTVARVDLQGPGGVMSAVYDAEIRAIASFDFEGYGSYKVLEHGYGFRGPVKVAAGQDVVLLSQRIAGAVQVPGTKPGAPVESVDVAEGYGEISVSLLAGTFIPQDSQVGAYYVSVTAPDGTEEDLVVATGLSKNGLDGYAFEYPDPAGTWTVRHVAGGPGTTLVEGLAYEPIVVDL